MTHSGAYPKKRLIVCCDGTWQVADRKPTTALSNVAKLSRMIHRESEGDNPFPQVVYYQSGVGTSSWGPLEQLPSALAALSAGIGVGLEDNVLTAYHFLSTNYYHPSYDDDSDKHAAHASDELFLFGFSRGAFTARALAGLVTELGLFRPEYLNEFRRAYELYRKVGVKAAERNLGSIKFIEKVKAVAHDLSQEDYDFLFEIHEHARYSVKDLVERKMERKKQERRQRLEKPTESEMQRIEEEARREEREETEKVYASKKMYEGVTIKVVGVWDTVGALGIPDSLLSWAFPWFNNQFKFHDAALNSKIENAFQALALDEHRGAFKPTLWYLDEKFLDGEKCPNLKQCWFPGFHESIGGGDTAMEHWTKKFLPETSEMHDVTLAWMCDQVDGLLRFDPEACEKILFKQDPDRVKWASAFETDMGIVLGLLFTWGVAGGVRRRTPGLYNLHNAEWKVRTNETMHPSVQYRIEATKGRLNHYFPPALKQHIASWWPSWNMEPRAPRWEFRENKDGKGAKWVRPAVPHFWLYKASEQLEIPEWVIREVGLHDHRKNESAPDQHKHEKEAHRINFEARLLPPEFKKRLEKRNEQMINEAEAVHEARVSAEEADAKKGGDKAHEWRDHLAEKQQFWTRTTWDVENYTQKDVHGRKAHKREAREEKAREERAREEEKGGKKQKKEESIAALKAREKEKANSSYGEDHSIMNGGAVQHA
ncbi:protein of unknown function DUF2235 [Macrophomina phaseolina MS6]|uniref:T6SS Phospholipase effector Tle1-like catalytic domain-containing protein n=1 Tax=Macrophomina phaseolina (strain MS6) TaxID=1126212 RepID=K2SBQ9_MACPH|nr:protein of unknown function DUF2235 [Macrophomina phaseolina MS6]